MNDAVRSHVDTVTILVQENQSFDRVMGWAATDWTGTGPPPDVHGSGAKFLVTAHPKRVDRNPFLVRRDATAVLRQMLPIPHHTRRLMREGWFEKDADPAAAGVARHHEVVAKSTKRQWVALAKGHIRDAVAYLPKESVPTYAHLAEVGTVFDRWFATEMAPTISNRYSLLQDRCSKPVVEYLQAPRPRLFSELPEGWDLVVAIDDSQTERWAHSLATFGCLPPAGKVVLLSELPGRLGDQRARGRKTLVWAESRHTSDRALRNNDHRYAHIASGQHFVWRLLNALQAADAGWRRTLAFVTYDEHGGWYDHVPPPRAPWCPPKGPTKWRHRLGGSVPAFALSAWLSGRVASTILENTAIVALLHALWDRTPARKKSLARHYGGDPFADLLLSDPREVMWNAPEPLVPSIEELQDEQRWTDAYLSPGEAAVDVVIPNDPDERVQEVLALACGTGEPTL